MRHEVCLETTEKTGVRLRNILPTARKRLISKTVMVECLHSAAQETDNLWRQIRRTESFLAEVRGWDAFIKGFRFAGKHLPVPIRPETMAHIEMLLTADLVRLRKQAAA